MKYALGLELTSTGFDFSVLSEFRARLLQGQMAGKVFEQVLRAAGERGLLKTAGRARTDSSHVLAASRAVNHTEMLGETLRAALNAVAAVFPDWLATQAAPEWFDRYGHRVEESRLPRSGAKRQEWVRQTGVDGIRLLDVIFSPQPPRRSPHQKESCLWRLRKASSSMASSGRTSGSTDSGNECVSPWPGWRREAVPDRAGRRRSHRRAGCRDGESAAGARRRRGGRARGSAGRSGRSLRRARVCVRAHAGCTSR
ncbi:hypothetical protein ABZ933_21840 [Streptomyces parvus]